MRLFEIGDVFALVGEPVAGSEQDKELPEEWELVGLLLAELDDDAAAAVHAWRVIADALPKDSELVRGLGADVVVPRGPEVASAIRLATGDGADALVDAAVMGHGVLAGVRDGGQVAAVRPFRGETERSIKVIGVQVRDYLHATDKLADLARLAAAGRLTLRVARTLPAQRAAEAHRLLEAGGVGGRLVLVF